MATQLRFLCVAGVWLIAGCQRGASHPVDAAPDRAADAPADRRVEGGTVSVDGPPDAAAASDGPAASSLCLPGEGAAVVRALQPKLFTGGADPSHDPECAGVLNPERGIFEFRDLRRLGPVADLRDRGFTLIYGKVLIDDYRTRDIDAALVDRLTAAFAAIRAAGVMPCGWPTPPGTRPPEPTCSTPR